MSLDINAANMEFTNEDETILSKLGIIQSTLECPKKKLNSKVGLKKVGGSHSDSNANHNIQVSSDDSSDDCLFDNERFSQTRKRRRLQNKSVLRLDNGNSYKFTKWHILSLVSAFLLIGISATTRDLAIFSIPNSNSSDNASFFTGFSASFGFSYTIGCLLAGCLFSRLNTFAIFLVLMVLSMPLSLLIVWNFHILSFNWTAFLAGTLLICIERGGLLVSSVCHNYQRMFFSLYMAVSLGSLIAALLNANSSGVLVSEDLMQFNNVSSPSKLLVKRDLGNLSAFIDTTPNLLSVMNSTTQLSQKTSTTVASLQINATTTIAPAVNKPIFSSKTEENMIRRKEVELRQKEKEKLMSTSTTAATTTTPAATSTSIITMSTTTTPTTTTTSTTVISTTTTPTTTPIASTTTSMITSPSTTSTTTISPPTQAMPTNASHLPGNISARPWTELAVVPSHTTQTCLTMLLIVLPVPLLLAFCCCQMSTSALPDARMLEMFSKSKERTTLDSEPVGCKVLSFLVWFIHATVDSILLVCLPMCSEQLIKSQTGGIQPAVMVNTLIWFPATVVRLFFVIKPSLGGSNALVIHLFYCSSIFVQLVLHFLIPLSETRTMATVLVAGLFSCSQPLMVYNWLSVFLEANPLHLSGRFLISQAIGRMVGTYAFNWLTGDKMSSDSAQQSIGRLFNSVLLLLIVAYMMFIWLSTSVHRAKRQMQIIHLSGEINGAQPPSGEPKTGRTKGQYKALLENCDESNDEENENMGFVLTEGEDSGSDRSFV